MGISLALEPTGVASRSSPCISVPGPFRTQTAATPVGARQREKGRPRPGSNNPPTICTPTEGLHGPESRANLGSPLLALRLFSERSKLPGNTLKPVQAGYKTPRNAQFAPVVPEAEVGWSSWVGGKGAKGCTPLLQFGKGVV